MPEPSRIALLLSGGAGTRLWPISTEQAPKQFMSLFGQQSLFQKTLERLRAAVIDEIWVIANRSHADLIARQASEGGHRIAVCLLEPERRDSAGAIAAGVRAVIERHGEASQIAVLPCDHLIADDDQFVETLRSGFDLACLGKLATFGIVPRFPSTDFGYIQRGERVAGHATAFSVARFHEKPPRERAEAYIASGLFYWNSGMFVFSGASFAREAAQHMGDIWAGAAEAVRHGQREGHLWSLDPDAFARLRKTSIDFGLFERSDAVGVVPASFEWADVGNWSAVHAANPADETGNVVLGSAMALDSSGCLIVGQGPRVLVSGVSDLVIVATREGVFVAPKARAADVKTLLERS